jgi:hypothetical protein
LNIIEYNRIEYEKKQKGTMYKIRISCDLDVVKMLSPYDYFMDIIDMVLESQLSDNNKIVASSWIDEDPDYKLHGCWSWELESPHLQCDYTELFIFIKNKLLGLMEYDNNVFKANIREYSSADADADADDELD